MPAVGLEIDEVMKARTDDPAATLPEKDSVSELLEASVTLMLTPYEVLAESTDMVPVIAPVELFRVSPAGSAPLTMLNVKGAMPPDVEINVDTGPTAIPGSDVDTMLIFEAGLAATVPENCLDCVWATESVTVMVKLKAEPPLVSKGVPDSTPVEVFKLTPDGNVPLETE